jgi:hypothetical protein
MGLGFLSSSSSINLLYITVHAALYEDLIPYVHVAHDLESLVRSTVAETLDKFIARGHHLKVSVLNTYIHPHIGPLLVGV